MSAPICSVWNCGQPALYLLNSRSYGASDDGRFCCGNCHPEDQRIARILPLLDKDEPSFLTELKYIENVLFDDGSTIKGARQRKNAIHFLRKIINAMEKRMGIRA